MLPIPECLFSLFLERKKVLGLRTEKVRHFFGGFFRKRRKKKYRTKLWQLFHGFNSLGGHNTCNRLRFLTNISKDRLKTRRQEIKCMHRWIEKDSSKDRAGSLNTSLHVAQAGHCGAGSGITQLPCLLDSRNSPNRAEVKGITRALS